MTLSCRGVLGLVVALASVGCAAPGRADADSGSGIDVEPTAGSSETGADESTGPWDDTGDEGPQGSSSGGAVDPDASMDDECASVSASAQIVRQPADIIVVVDNSGSMGTETAAVQANLNSFSQQIIESGVDVHVTLVTASSICIAAPLGSGACPVDSNPPLFSHIDRVVGSTDALSAVLQTQPQWLPSMRSQALKHVIVVTDDDSALPAQSFHEQFSVVEPSFADYKLHGVVSMHQCPEAARVGSVYIELGTTTGGLVSDLCDQNFQPVFDLLSTEVTQSAGLACEYDIPESPSGSTFNPSEVNMDFDDGGGIETIGHVESLADCAGVVDGWYYDNPIAPTQLIACPDTCARFEAVGDATIDIRFGCDTIPAG